MHRTLEHRVENTRMLELCLALRLGSRAGRRAWRIGMLETFNGRHTIARAEPARSQSSERTCHPQQPEHRLDSQHPGQGERIIVSDPVYGPHLCNPAIGQGEMTDLYLADRPRC